MLHQVIRLVYSINIKFKRINVFICEDKKQYLLKFSQNEKIKKQRFKSEFVFA
jgi:hypothetical protein